ncbi:MAG: endoribonuclease MazF [Proteobacteria bacterium]|nr:endoribonuclease MazF [Pseudomonadota bacterium]
MVKYIPDAGDIVWLDFDPQAGREQKGHRPALVISPKVYNTKTKLMLCCPMTTKIKGYPFEVAVASEKESVILSDQIKSLDWQQRNAKFKGRISVVELEDVCAKIKAILLF